MGKELKPFNVKIIEEAESDWSGPVPANIDTLVKKPNKDHMTLLYQIAKTQIELLCQKGNTDEAMEVLKKVMDQSFEYQNPLNTFKRDLQNGGYPYLGGHSFFAAFHDAANFLYPKFFYQKKGDKTPSKDHLRKFVKVRPYHVFFHRPNLSGDVVTEIDFVDGQQPSPKVKGFSRYEVLKAPFQVEYNVSIQPKGPFADFLGDHDIVKECIEQGSYHGRGGRRAAGFGQTKIVEMVIR